MSGTRQSYGTHNRAADQVDLLSPASGCRGHCFAFPLLLWIGGKVAGFTLRYSMSAYYWATPDQLCPCGENPDHSCSRQGSKVTTNVMPSPQDKILKPGTMRNWFVGILFAVGALLFINQGHSPKEDWALNLAGYWQSALPCFPCPGTATVILSRLTGSAP